MEKGDIHELRLLGEIEKDGAASQRELSRRLNLSLGLTNAFIKRLISKGYFKVRTMPRNRVKYFLTPKGLARKSRLTVEYLRYSVGFYGDIKTLLMRTYLDLEERNIRTLLFFGAGEVAELAYLYLRMTGIRLAGIVDDGRKGTHFFEFKVAGMGRLEQSGWDAVLLTRLDDTDRDVGLLTAEGVPMDRIVIL